MSCYVYRLHVDAVSARAILQVNGYDAESRAMLDDLISGLGDFMNDGADDL